MNQTKHIESVVREESAKEWAGAESAKKRLKTGVKAGVAADMGVNF